MLKLLSFITGILWLSYIIPAQNIIYKKPVNSNISVLKSKSVPHLKIPKIGVNVFLEKVGITTNGILDVPKNFINAGLYALWPFPWEKGNAVIDGHYGWINKKWAVFNNLYKLKKWDNIYVYDSKWNIIIFVVNIIKIYKQNENTTDIFNSNDSKAHLNIITCQWIWDKYKKSYPNRLVVFADRKF